MCGRQLVTFARLKLGKCRGQNRTTYPCGYESNTPPPAAMVRSGDVELVVRRLMGLRAPKVPCLGNIIIVCVLQALA